jgi:diadenylate cyclase
MIQRPEKVRLDPPVGEMDHVRGVEDAPVTLVEFGDYECPYCGRAYPVVQEIQRQMGDALRFVYRHLPLDSVHPRARRAAEVAEAAAAQGRFWEMHDLLFENQGALAEEDLRRYARELGLDLLRFEEDLARRRYAGPVEENVRSAVRSGVEGTPTFFINGVRHDGSHDLEPLLAAVEKAASAGPEEPAPTMREPITRGRTDPLDEICSARRGVDRKTLRRVVDLAVEIAREGREGRKIGTLFVVGDSEAVIEHSKPMILDPLAGHPDQRKRITDPNMRETLKELAQLDGAFVVSDEGVVVSAARYIDVASEDLDLPLGLGSRHMAAASISLRTDAVAVVVSESSVVRMFDDGQLVAEITPELWMLGGYVSRLSGPTRMRTRGAIAVTSRDEE